MLHNLTTQRCARAPKRTTIRSDLSALSSVSLLECGCSLFQKTYDCRTSKMLIAYPLERTRLRTRISVGFWNAYGRNARKRRPLTRRGEPTSEELKFEGGGRVDPIGGG
jgi:hypothetical protein